MRLTNLSAYNRPLVPKMPPGLVELMEGLTRDVLKNNPPDVYKFCADYMQKLLEMRDGTPLKKPLTVEQKVSRAQEKVRQRAKERQAKFDETSKLLPKSSEIAEIQHLQPQILLANAAKVPENHEQDLIEIPEMEISRTGDKNICKTGSNSKTLKADMDLITKPYQICNERNAFEFVEDVNQRASNLDHETADHETFDTGYEHKTAEQGKLNTLESEFLKLDKDTKANKLVESLATQKQEILESDTLKSSEDLKGKDSVDPLKTQINEYLGADSHTSEDMKVNTVEALDMQSVECLNSEVQELREDLKDDEMVDSLQTHKEEFFDPEIQKLNKDLKDIDIVEPLKTQINEYLDANSHCSEDVKLNTVEPLEMQLVKCLGSEFQKLSEELKGDDVVDPLGMPNVDAESHKLCVNIKTSAKVEPLPIQKEENLEAQKFSQANEDTNISVKEETELGIIKNETKSSELFEDISNQEITKKVKSIDEHSLENEHVKVIDQTINEYKGKIHTFPFKEPSKVDHSLHVQVSNLEMDKELIIRNSNTHENMLMEIIKEENFSIKFMKLDEYKELEPESLKIENVVQNLDDKELFKFNNQHEPTLEPTNPILNITDIRNTMNIINFMKNNKSPETELDSIQQNKKEDSSIKTKVKGDVVITADGICSIEKMVAGVSSDVADVTHEYISISDTLASAPIESNIDIEDNQKKISSFEAEADEESSSLNEVQIFKSKDAHNNSDWMHEIAKSGNMKEINIHEELESLKTETEDSNLSITPETVEPNLLEKAINIENTTNENRNLEGSKTSEDKYLNTDHSTMDLETAAITIQKVFRSFLFKSRASTLDELENDEPNLLDEDDERRENNFSTTDSYEKKERRTTGISRMDTVLQTVNEEKSLSLSTDDSSTLSSAATTIQAHVRGFLTRNKFSNKSISSPHINFDTQPSKAQETESEQQQKTVLNIHIIPERGHTLSRDESILTSIDLPLDVSPFSSINLHPLGYDKSEPRKQLKREDAVQSVSPPSNNSGKSLDADSVRDEINTNNTLQDVIEKGKEDNMTKDDRDFTADETIKVDKLVRSNIPENFESGNVDKINLSFDELDVITPFVSYEQRKTVDIDEYPKLMHSGEFHDVVLPTKVSRAETSVVRGE